MRSLVVVGNASLGADYSRLVDAADIVIRINDCKNHNGKSGSKSTMICANNTGVPARRACARKPYLTNELCRAASEYWFPRSGPVHRTYIRQRAIEYPESEFVDFSKQLVFHNQLEGKAITYPSAEFNVRVFNTLLAEMRRLGMMIPFVCPSTGFLAIEYAMTSPRFFDFRKHLLGFGFDGWKGHPWQVEQSVVAHYVRQSKLLLHPIGIAQVPADSG